LNGKLIWYVGVAESSDAEKGISQGVNNAVTANGGKFAYSTGVNSTTGAFSLANQVLGFKRAIAAKADAIVYFALSPEAMKAQVAQARDAGIPVFAVYGKPAAGVKVNGWVDNDNVAQGRTLAGALASQLPKGSKVTVIAGISGAALAQQEIDGALAEFRAKGLNFVGSVAQQHNEQGNAAGGQTVMRGILAKFPDVKGVLAYNDESVAGAIAAAKSAGADPGKKILFVSRNGSDQGVDLIKQGSLFATCDVYPVEVGQIAAQAAADQILARKQYDGAAAIPPPSGDCLVDAQKVDTYKKWDQRVTYVKFKAR
jgi:ABC-type sugar transport system substrate-binding protein